MTWVHPYREGMIPVEGTINGTRPGHAIARSITELQELCVNAIEIDSPDGSITHSESIQNNVLKIVLAVANPVPPEEENSHRNYEDGGGGGLPPGGETYQVLQRDATGAAVWDWVRAVDSV
jgi:hypothetical protein